MLSLKTELQENMKMRAWESRGGIIILLLVLSKCQKGMPFCIFFFSLSWVVLSWELVFPNKMAKIAFAVQWMLSNWTANECCQSWSKTTNSKVFAYYYWRKTDVVCHYYSVYIGLPFHSKCFTVLFWFWESPKNFQTPMNITTKTVINHSTQSHSKYLTLKILIFYTMCH